MKTCQKCRRQFAGRSNRTTCLTCANRSKANDIARCEWCRCPSQVNYCSAACEVSAAALAHVPEHWEPSPEDVEAFTANYRRVICNICSEEFTRIEPRQFVCNPCAVRITETKGLFDE